MVLVEEASEEGAEEEGVAEEEEEVEAAVLEVFNI